MDAIQAFKILLPAERGTPLANAVAADVLHHRDFLGFSQDEVAILDGVNALANALVHSRKRKDRLRNNPGNPALAALIGDEAAEKVAHIDIGTLAMMQESALKEKGLTPKQAKLVRAAVVFAVEAARTAPLPTQRMSAPKDVVDLMAPRMSLQGQEEIWVVYSNQRSTLIDAEMVAKGSSSRSLVPVREIIQRAMHHNANRLFLLHNHPSGDATPSHEDFEVTRRMRDACLLVDLKLIDHLIIARGSYTSLAARGLCGP